MKVKVVANEVVDGEVDFISLVKHGANRSPFKIVKADEVKLDLNAFKALANLNAEQDSRTAVSKQVSVSDRVGEQLLAQRERSHLARCMRQLESQWGDSAFADPAEEVRLRAEIAATKDRLSRLGCPVDEFPGLPTAFDGISLRFDDASWADFGFDQGLRTTTYDAVQGSHEDSQPEFGNSIYVSPYR